MVRYRYWHLMVPVPVMAYMHLCPLPVLAWYITVTDIKWCQNRYWHICTFVQYQYWHDTLPVLALNGARAGIGVGYHTRKITLPVMPLTVPVTLPIPVL
jgi:hypothetical protein